MPSWSWAIVVSSRPNAWGGLEGNPGSMLPATAREASSANSRRDKGAMVQPSNEKVEELGRPTDVFEWDVQDLIPLPVPKVEMPPLARVRNEPFGFQHAAQQGAVPALARRAARIIGEGTRRGFVVGRGHFDRPSRRQFVYRDVHRRPAVVFRALRGIRHEPMGLGGRRVP